MTKRQLLAIALAGCVSLGLHAAEDVLPAPSATPLFWTGDEQVAGFRNMNRLFPARDVRAGKTPLALPVAERDFDTLRIGTGKDAMTVADYMTRQRVAGLLVVKDGTIVYERYRLGNDHNSLWVSFSVTKSVVSMLIGAAIKDGYINSPDESVTDYLPRLRHSSYDASSIENLLQMASGVEWDENYADPESDVASAPYTTLALYEYLRNKPRAAKPGEKFNYNTAETNLAGTLLRSAIGNNLSTYLEEKIWRPFGMESDAYWMLSEPGGGEMGGCCISATLRDYARIGLFAMADGVLADGTRVLPEGWMQRSTTPSQGFDGYGYFWWLRSDEAYAASGIFGQGIYINPARGVVIAQHSARPDADKDEDWALQDAVFEALTDAASP